MVVYVFSPKDLPGMLFYAPIFLFIYLPLALVTVGLVNHRYRSLLLLVWSIAFYLWGEPTFVGVAMLSAIVDYFICQQIFKHRETPPARLYLGLGVGLNLLLLIYYKYVDFGITTINALLQPLGWADLSLLKIALPIGVSFLVFEKITYLVDVYRGQGAPARSLQDYLLYVFLFPKLLAGPIIKYHDIADQIADSQAPNAEEFFLGFRRFLLGLVKKVLLADTLSEIADEVFGLPLQQLGFTTAWLGVIGFSLQIYFDFSAYSDMAIGLARMFGFRLLENFNQPYISTSFTDFWRRWHISLSTWIKEYLYISLGGNRHGVLRTYLNLCICFLLSGLWHGASWTFVLWGAYHGLFLVLDKLFWLKLSQQWPNFLRIALTLPAIMVGWLLFRSTSLDQFGAFMQALVMPGRLGTTIYTTPDIGWALGLGCLISLIPAGPWFRRGLAAWQGLRWSPLLENWLLSGLAVVAIGKAVTVTFNPFLYFRF
jgi:alginate O-acetyltransferase complex protein AlgI